MDFSLTAEQKELQAIARKFARERVRPRAGAPGVREVHEGPAAGDEEQRQEECDGKAGRKADQVSDAVTSRMIARASSMS